MTCEELCDHYELYALGVADETEGAEIRAHIQRQCPTCAAGVRAARNFSALLGATAEPAAPSPQLRKRILASVGVEPAGLHWGALWAAVAALSVCGVIYVGSLKRQSDNEAALLRSKVASQSSELAGWNEAFAILNGPGTMEASFGQGQPRPPRGKVFVNPSRGVLLVASSLAPAPGGRIYEMWIIPKAGKPVAAGVFQSDSNGTAVHVERGAVDLSTTGAVAVTLENEGGAPQPTSQPLIVAALSAP